MKHIALFTTILVLLLTSCIAIPAFTPTSTPTPTLTRTPTIVPSATPSPTPAISPAVTMLGAYLAGEQVDTSSLSPEEFADFSKALAEKRNEERGVQLVIYDSGDDNPAYIDQNLDMRPYDGIPDQSKTIEMFIPVAGFDNQGNLQIEENGKIITIANSADVDWNMIVTDSTDPRINWPTGGHLGKDFLKPMVENGTIMIKPAIVLDKYIHSFYVQYYGMHEGIRILFIEETDINGVPLVLRLSLAIGAPWFHLREGGTDIDISNMSELKSNNLYYLGIRTDVNHVYESINNGSVDNYRGIVTNDDVIPVLMNELENKHDFLVVPVLDLLFQE